MATGEPKLANGAIGRCAKKFGVSGPAISGVWKAMKENLATGLLTSSPLKKVPASRQKYCRNALTSAVAALPFHQRRTLRDMANVMGVGKSTLHRILRKETDDSGNKLIVPHTNSLMPLITEEHKVARVFYALSKLDPVEGHYSSFFQDVHVDEKWFEVTPNRMRVYVTPGEVFKKQLPTRKVVHKSHVQKVMFLAATARPRYDRNGNCTFDGKIGIWPFVTKQPARRSSVNRPAGTMETKPVAVNHEVYRRMLLDKVVPAIRDRFPHRNRSVTIQQDGAGAHISANDPQFLEELARIQGKLIASCSFFFYFTIITNIAAPPFFLVQVSGISI